MLELPGSGAIIQANTDIEACVKAKEYLAQRGQPKGYLNLFRLPLEWVRRNSEMIWVPLFRFI